MLNVTYNFELFLIFIIHCFSIYRVIPKKNLRLNKSISIGTLIRKNAVRDFVHTSRVVGNDDKGFGVYLYYFTCIIVYVTTSFQVASAVVDPRL